MRRILKIALAAFTFQVLGGVAVGLITPVAAWALLGFTDDMSRVAVTASPIMFALWIGIDCLAIGGGLLAWLALPMRERPKLWEHKTKRRADDMRALADKITTADDLSPRQAEVFKLIVQGKSNKEIARALNLGVGTVKIHIKSMMDKLGVRNRAGFALAASANDDHAKAVDVVLEAAKLRHRRRMVDNHEQGRQALLDHSAGIARIVKHREPESFDDTLQAIHDAADRVKQ